MYHRLPKSIVYLFIAVLSIGAALAQGTTNFSGEWTMNASKSDFGPAPAPEMMTRTIKHQDPNLEISTHQKGVAGETTTQTKYTTDGKESVNKLPTGDAKGTAKWQGDSLVIETAREFQGIQIKGKESWTLSDGGKMLTILNHVSIPQQGEFDLKLVFDKK
jgi:hypothetical protein